jgi:hypothetical protein
MGMEAIFGFADNAVASLPGQPFGAKPDLEFRQLDDDEMLYCKVRMGQGITMIPLLILPPIISEPGSHFFTGLLKIKVE